MIFFFLRSGDSNSGIGGSVLLTTGRGLQFTSGAMNLQTSNSGSYGGSGPISIGTSKLTFQIIDLINVYFV